MVAGFVILGLVAIGVALVVRNSERIKPGQKAPRAGRAGITPVYRRSSGNGVNGSSIGFLGIGGGFDSNGSGGFDGGSCGSSDGGSGGGDGGGNSC